MRLREFGSPIADLSDPLPYLEMQKFFDADYPAHNMRYYWKSHYLASLPDDAIAVLINLNEGSPSPHSTLDIWQLGGAFSRPGASDTAFGDRSAPGGVSRAGAVCNGRRVYEFPGTVRGQR
jgi:hypothetical protein